jgi:hypothetical protein
MGNEPQFGISADVVFRMQRNAPNPKCSAVSPGMACRAGASAAAPSVAEIRCPWMAQNVFGISAAAGFSRMQEIHQPANAAPLDPGHGLLSRSKCRCSLGAELVLPKLNGTTVFGISADVVFSHAANALTCKSSARQPGHGLQSRSKCRCALGAEFVAAGMAQTCSGISADVAYSHAENSPTSKSSDRQPAAWLA